MSFVHPQAFLLLLAVPLVLLFHLFRARRVEVRVTTLRFWRARKQEREATYAVFRRLNANPLLFLQILAVLLVTLALAGPIVTSSSEGPARLVLIVDTSASMKAMDVPGGRFTVARDEALAVVAQLTSGQQAMLLEAALRPAVLVQFTDDQRMLEDALTALQPTDGPGNLETAIEMASELVRDGPPAELRVFTDGAFPRFALPEGETPRLRWHRVGRESNNVGITALEVRRSLTASSEYEVFLGLSNFSPDAKNFSFRLVLDGAQLYEQPLDLPGGVTRAFVVPFSHQTGGVLRIEIDPHDDLAVDDIAAAVLPEPQAVKVLLVTRGNPYLEKALRIMSQVRLESLVPELFVSGESDADVVVLDGLSPDFLPPGRYLLIRSLPGDAPLQELGSVRFPSIVDWNKEHPVMHHADLSKVVIEQAMKVRVVGDGQVLAESNETPLMFAWNNGQVRAILLGFDLHQSDIVFRAAFPLIIGNALRWLAPGRLEDVVKQYRPGQPIEVDTEASIKSATVVGPDGRTTPVSLENGRLVYDGAHTAGLYALHLGDLQHRIAVNLLDRDESHLTPGRGIPEKAGMDGAPQETHRVAQEIWRHLVTLALLVIAVEAFFYVHRRRWAVSPSALAVRAVVLSLVSLSLIRPQLTVASDVVHTAFLLDHSDSIPTPQKRQALESLQAALTSRREHDTARLVIFDAAARLAPIPEKRADLPRAPSITTAKEPRTDIAQAIRMAMASLPRTGTRRILLVSDGNENRGSSLEAAREARRQGVAIYAHPIGGPDPGEVLLDRMTLPQKVKQGEPFDVDIVAWSTGDGEGELSLYRNGTFVVSQPVRLSAGKNRFSYREVQDREDFHVYQARLEVAGDVVEENNRATAVVAVGSLPRVLYVEKDREQGRHLLAALKVHKIDVDSVVTEEISEALERLPDYDAVILGNVSALAMTKAQMKSIQSFVRDRGGGLLMLGGEESFGLGGYYRTPIEAALPVTMESRQKVDVPSMAVVLVIDRSGSMNAEQGQLTRMDLAKEAAQLAVELLGKQSEVGVIAFDARAKWVVPIGPARDKKAITRKIASIQAGGGGTELFWAIEDVYQAIAARDAVLRHVIILSDGETLMAGFPELLAQMARDKITVSSIAISSEAGVDLLQKISQWGRGRFYFTGDVYSVPRIFTMETQLASKAGLIEQSFRPAVRNQRHEILKGIEWGRMPPLEGYVTATPKVVAETLLVSHQQDPILSVWRYGLGRAAAFTSDAKTRWGARWLAWRDFGKFFSQLVRWTMGGRDSGEMATTLRIEGGQGEILVESVDAEGAFRNFLDVQAGLVLPDKSRRVVPLVQSGLGRYIGTFPAASQGAYLTGISLYKDSHVLASEVAGGIASHAAEYRVLSVNKALLDALTEATGGRTLNDPTGIFDLDRGRSSRAVEVWPWIVLLALVLLLCDLGLRWNSMRKVAHKQSNR